MTGKSSALIKVADEEIRNLKEQSEAHNQETRVSVYHFGDATIECLIFDMDVARLPSTKDLYKVLRENTALIDATLKSQEDLATTSQLYGDHAFLTFVLTDGEENRSRRRPSELANHIKTMPENWSLGFLVPNETGRQYVERLGVLADSVAIWNINSASGLSQVGTAVRSATNNFFTARASGVRGTRSVFSTGADAVNRQTVSENLEPIKGYTIHTVATKSRIDDFVASLGKTFVKGANYYQLMKSETIQPQKKILVLDKRTGSLYGGAAARQLIGLPNTHIRVRPQDNPDYEVFVQSTSFNRNLVPNTKLVILK